MSYTWKTPDFSTCIIVFILLIVFPVSVYGSPVSDNPVIVLYGLYPVSGEKASIGEAQITAFERAVSDINTYLESTGSDVRVISSIERMSSEPESALEKLTKLHDMGAPVVLTSLSDIQAETVQDDINSDGIVLLSTGCSSPSLAVKEDNLIRFTPDDTIEARVTARWFSEKQYLRIVPFVRDDSWGGGLVKEISMSLPDGITIGEGIYYNPGTTDFSQYLSDLDKKIGQLSGSLKPKQISVYAVTGKEIQLIMSDITKQEYKNLTGITWTGCSANAQLSELTGVSEPAKTAYSLNFTALSLGSDLQAPKESAFQYLKDRNSGAFPDGNTLATYDMVWIVFKSLILNGELDTDSIRKAVLTMTEQHKGLSGEYLMNENDDRISGVYNIYGLTEGSEGISWKLLSYAGIWSDSKNPAGIELISKD